MNRHEPINDIIKEYPKMYRVIIYKAPRTFERTKNSNSPSSSLNDSLDISIRRTRRVLHDYVHCNEFDLFVTFTFNPRKVNRYDMDMVYTKMQGWLFRQHQKNHLFRYLIVPERHKDGAIHFHALIAGAPFTLKKTNVIQNSKRVYNVSAFKFGFTNATKLSPDEAHKAANYIAKYITKDMIVLHNKRRYWCSRNLQKPITFRNHLYSLPRLLRSLNHTTLAADNEFSSIYEVPLHLLD